MFILDLEYKSEFNKVKYQHRVLTTMLKDYYNYTATLPGGFGMV